MDDVGDIPGILPDRWDLSMAAYNAGKLCFLESRYITAANEILRIPVEGLNAILAAAAEVRSDEMLSRMVWHCHCLLYTNDEYIDPWEFYFPLLKNEYGELKDLLGMVILLSGLEGAVDFLKSRNIPEDIVLAIFSDAKRGNRRG